VSPRWFTNAPFDPPLKRSRFAQDDSCKPNWRIKPLQYHTASVVTMGSLAVAAAGARQVRTRRSLPVSDGIRHAARGECGPRPTTTAFIEDRGANRMAAFASLCAASVMATCEQSRGNRAICHRRNYYSDWFIEARRIKVRSVCRKTRGEGTESQGFDWHLASPRSGVNMPDLRVTPKNRLPKQLFDYLMAARTDK